MPFAGGAQRSRAATAARSAACAEAVERGFCRDCSTPLIYRMIGKDRISVSLGSLDDPGRVKPVVQYGVESRPPGGPSRSSGGDNGGGTDPELLARMRGIAPASRQALSELGLQIGE